VQLIIARNIDALLDRHFAREKTRTAQERAFAKKAETSLSQIQRARAGSTAVGVDVLERIADAFGVRVADMVREGYFAEMSPGAQLPAASTGELQPGESRKAALSRS